MSIPPSFRHWLMTQTGGNAAFRALVRRIGADEATCELGEALSQWQLHFAESGASHDERAALRAAWWRYIESRAASAAMPSAAGRVVRSLERGLAQWVAPAVTWLKSPRSGAAATAITQPSRRRF